MPINPELLRNSNEILSLKLTWPKSLKGIEKIWRNVSGQQKAYTKGLENWVRLTASTVAHTLGNPLSPIVGYGELLSNLPSVQSDPTAAEFVGEIIENANIIKDRINLFNDYQAIMLDEATVAPYPTLDLEASSQPSQK